MKQIKTYAPVIIPTLFRINHFKNCIESLSRCTGADKTEIYIGIDFPLTEVHEKGRKLIIEYLKNSGINKKFKNIHVFIWDHNLGVGANGNFYYIMNEVLKKHDRYIMTEDDNIFSPNFLNYINRGLEKSETDTSILAVCGYCHQDNVIYDDNNFHITNIGFSPWGYGILKAKRDEFKRNFNRSFYLKKVLNPFSLIKAAHHSWSTFLFLLLCCIKPELDTDNVWNLQMWYQKKNVISPIISKVRNEGFDGSGVHCGLDKFFYQKDIDTEADFTYIGTGYEYYSENNAIHLAGQRSYMTFNKVCKNIFHMIIARMRK